MLLKPKVRRVTIMHIEPTCFYNFSALYLVCTEIEARQAVIENKLFLNTWPER
ncbi:MAG: hypothetical protein ACJAXH_003461 [Colwellia sp.]|jgi:hypothetical protein